MRQEELSAKAASFGYFSMPLVSFALSLSKGHTFILRQAQDERRQTHHERTCFNWLMTETLLPPGGKPEHCFVGASLVGALGVCVPTTLNDFGTTTGRRKTETPRQPVSRVLYPRVRTTVIYLGLPLPTASCGQPGDGPDTRSSPYSALLRMGLAWTPAVASGAVSSYLTFSPLLALGERSVSVALSVGSPPPRR